MDIWISWSASGVVGGRPLGRRHDEGGWRPECRWLECRVVDGILCPKARKRSLRSVVVRGGCPENLSTAVSEVPNRTRPSTISMPHYGSLSIADVSASMMMTKRCG